MELSRIHGGWTLRTVGREQVTHFSWLLNNFWLFFFFWFDVMLLPCTCRTQLFFSHVFKRFSRKRFIICIERGLLTLPIIFDRECRVCVRRYWERKKKKRRGMPIIAYCQENVSISFLFLFCILERWNSKHFFFLFVRFCCLHNLWVASLHGAFTVDKQLTSCFFFFNLSVLQLVFQPILKDWRPVSRKKEKKFGTVGDEIRRRPFEKLPSPFLIFLLRTTLTQTTGCFSALMDLVDWNTGPSCPATSRL